MSCKSKSGKRIAMRQKMQTQRVWKPAIIITSSNGALKAYRGVRDSICGNPRFEEKDSIPADKFILLIADTTTVILRD